MSPMTPSIFIAPSVKVNFMLWRSPPTSLQRNCVYVFSFYFIKISRSEAYIFISQELSLSLVRVMNCVTGIVCSSLTPSCRSGKLLLRQHSFPSVTLQTVVWFHCGRSLQAVTISNSVSLSLMMKQLVAVGARYVLMSSSGSPEQLRCQSCAYSCWVDNRASNEDSLPIDFKHASRLSFPVIRYFPSNLPIIAACQCPSFPATNYGASFPPCPPPGP